QDQGKAKGLAACNSQTASPFGCLNNFYFRILSNFLGSLHFSKNSHFRNKKKTGSAFYLPIFCILRLFTHRFQ
ncbi:hypothetical protein, partial [Hominenteromicrobium sp.]|uniref:hypothetical protein n=1 Tax=Hominenteromicrobium sp. TaxID=3073581 RepID=UPI003AB22B2D